MKNDQGSVFQAVVALWHQEIDLKELNWAT
jgi:hypothetical protein